MRLQGIGQYFHPALRRELTDSIDRLDNFNTLSIISDIMATLMQRLPRIVEWYK